MNNGINRRTESQRRGDYLVPGTDASCNHADMKRGGTGIDGRGLRRQDSLVFRELSFKPRHLWAGSQPSRFQGGNNLVDLSLMDLRRAEDNEWLCHGLVGARARFGVKTPSIRLICVPTSVPLSERKLPQLNRP